MRSVGGSSFFVSAFPSHLVTRVQNQQGHAESRIMKMALHVFGCCLKISNLSLRAAFGTLH